MKYELRYDGIIEQSDSFDVLWKKSLLLQSEYIIYQCFQSRINGVYLDDPDAESDVERIIHKTVRVIRKKSRPILKKLLSESEIEMAISEVERGYSKTTIARKYRVTLDHLSRLIREYENAHT